MTAAEALIGPKETLQAPLIGSVPRALASVPGMCTHQGGHTRMDIETILGSCYHTFRAYPGTQKLSTVMPDKA